MSDDEWLDDEDHSSPDGQSSSGNVALKKKENWGLLDDLSAEYDYLSTTPPRTRIRNKGKNKNHIDESSNPGSPRFSKIVRRNTTDTVITKESSQDNYENKKAKRRSLKTLRGHERDLKLDIEKCKSNLIDSGPKPVQVLTNNRFLSLCPQLVQREPRQQKSTHWEITKSTSEPLAQDCRASFHDTFSMLIKMRTSDKSCKRTVSIEHTWKNELKDLIWLEVTAWHAGRTATQQDIYLLAKRENVPNLLQKILDYKFENTEYRCTGGGVWKTQVSVLSADSGVSYSPNEAFYDIDQNQAYERTPSQCLCIDCDACTKSVGKAMNEIETLLNSLAEAESLYSSCKSMSTEHPVVNSDAFLNKVKAMCLWYNMVHHQRLKILILKKIVQKNMVPKKISHVHEKTPDNLVDNETNTRVTFDIPNIESDGKNPNSVESLNCNESDDDNDVKQSTKIHIEVTKSKTMNSDDKSELNVETCSENEKLFPVNSDNLKSPYESTDSSGGSVISNESGFVSSVYENSDENLTQVNKNKIDVYDLGSLKELTKLRLYNPKISSPYRDYIEKMLKVRGLRRALYFLEKLHVEVLKKARMTLEIYKNDMQDTTETNDDNIEKNVDSNVKEDNDSSDDDFQYERHTRYDVDIDELKSEYLELKRYGAWSKETLEMCLPSYRNIFLLLSTIPIETIHEFLTMRLETKPEKPSALSIKQLIQELREGLAIAVRLRGRFTRHVSTALMAEKEDSKQRKFYANVVATFDDTLNKVYKLYLSYLSDWAAMEYLPRTSLLAEWTFNRYLAQRLYLATTISPLTFCCLTIRQLEGAAIRLKTKVLELKNTALLFAFGVTKPDGHDDIKLGVLKVCRDIQSLLSEERERVLSTAQFARIVSKHLYHNDVFRSYRRKIYKAMACVLSVLRSTIKKLQDITTPKRLTEIDELDRPSVQSRTKEIISQTYKFGFEFHKEMYYLINDGILSEDPKGKSRLHRSDSVCSDSLHSSVDENYFPFTPFTPTSTFSEFVYPVNYKLQSKDEEALKFSLYGHRNTYKNSPRFDKQFNEEFLSELGPEDFSNVPGCEKCCGTVFCDNELNSCDKYPTTEYNSSDCNWHRVISKNLIDFAEEWMTFVVTRCERGKGRRPRWATHGLEFLVLTCDPQHTKYLTDEEFEKLKAMMDGCISHVIGSSAVANIGNSQSIQTPTTKPRISLNHPINFNKSFQSVSPSTPPTEYSQNLLFSSDNIDSIRYEKQIAALNELDTKRDADLRRTNFIGSVKHSKESRDHFRPRPVKFKWQRGKKIGQGRFGKVYTVVNIESGQLLAMKEIGVGIGDRRSFDRAANELQILEGVVHPNLVRYYGVEIYREEMLIFMELCVEGSLESLVANCNNTNDEENGNGLPEQLIRRYTGQIVSAVIALHERSIAHRDIKSGNIFLTEEGKCLKLGDFGCAVKIRANTTVPGELQGYIGTQAYMAPEVFMKSSGHGRAADIWSLGCVVVEMASGKHPWSECDSNYQIMYKVGTGNRPDIPNTLSQEGVEFCIACLQHDPTERATAANLAQHHFLKVNKTDYFY